MAVFTGLATRLKLGTNLLFFTMFITWTNADLVDRCEDTCLLALNEAGSSGRLSCDQNCRLNSCTSGCRLWGNSTLEICNDECNSTYSSDENNLKVQFCLDGCLYAEDEYAAAIIDKVGMPLPPYVVSMESITNVSVDIGWREADHSAVSYILQWSYADIEGSLWTSYHREPVTVLQSTVMGLHPFITYKFRIQWVITARHMLCSPASIEVTTDAYGAPLSGPTIAILVSPSPTTISISWTPPTFPSGAIIGYTVRLLSTSDDNRTLDTALTSHTFVGLVPDVVYTLEVTARNSEGGTSPVASDSITTQPPLNYTGVQSFLVLGVTALDFVTERRGSYVSFLDTKFANDPSDVHIVDMENTTIEDVAVHYWKELLYISDSSGLIHRRNVNMSNLGANLIIPSDVIYNGTGVATSLAVDWLFDHLYFVQENLVLRCDLACSMAPEVVVSLDTRPTELHIDPYNGFMYWSELSEASGIYRLDLVHLGNNSYERRQRILNVRDVESFLIDPTGYRVIYPNADNDTMMAAFLDGAERAVLRVDDRETIDYFTNVSNVVYFDGLFVWTRYDEAPLANCTLARPSYTYNKAFMYYEDSARQINPYTFFYCGEVYHGMDIYHPQYQPVPAPATPPTGLRVLFSDTAAQVWWSKPRNLDVVGEGAWQDWTYEIEVTSQALAGSTIVSSTQGLTTRLVNLTSSSLYSIGVRGYSPTAKGPWSDSFVGRTLKRAVVDPYVVYSSSDGITKINLDGSWSTNIINRSNIRDLAWNDDLLYWCDTTGAVYSTNMTNPQETLTQLPVTSYTQALAVDWLTGKLYRGKSNQQDLAIDSLNAYIYWTTIKTVECSRFDGEERFDYERFSGISDDLIAGLTLDLEGGFVYWLSLSNQDSAQTLKLYRAELATNDLVNPSATKVEVGVIPSSIERVVLSFYSQKLLWINEQDEIIIGDVEGNSLVALPAGSPATALTVIHSSLHPLPDGFTSMPTVVPTPIPAESIEIVGPWDDFNITWRPSSEVNFGAVFYDISVSLQGVPTTAVLQEASFNMKEVAPFQPLVVSILAYTNWGSAELVTVTRTSPMSVPTVPLNPRAFVTDDRNIYMRTSNYSASFRWETVRETNGILLGFKVHWRSSDADLVTRTFDNETLEFTVRNLRSDATYYFQVAGFTPIGSGPVTTPVSISTNASTPPPTLITIRPSAITLTDMDINLARPLVAGQGVSATAVAYIAQEELLIWADGVKEKVKSSHFDGTDEQELFDIASQPPPSGLTVDWLARCIYVLQDDKILKYDLTLETMVTVAEAQEGPYLGVVVDPLNSRLFWTEATPFGVILMTSGLQGQSSQPLLGSVGGKRQACSCIGSMPLGGAIAMDQSDASNPELFFVNGDTGDIWASDLTGCQCRLVVIATNQHGLPPDSLTVDHTTVYWANYTRGVLASANKVTGQEFRSDILGDTSVLAAFGTNLQPYPDPDCLAPPGYNDQAQLLSWASSTLNLSLPVIAILPGCIGVSVAAVTYTVHYGRVDSGVFETEMTVDPVVVFLDSLEPFTYYTIQVSASNYYTVGEPLLGPEVIYMTGLGVPSEALNVTVAALDPYSVTVNWSPPSEPNGPIGSLQYRVRYTYVINGTKYISLTDPSAARNLSGSLFEASVAELLGATQYQFEVQTYPQIGEAFSLSATVASTTYQTPQFVQLLNITNTTIAVAWTSPGDASVMAHRMEYLYAGNKALDPMPSAYTDSSTWTGLDEVMTKPNTVYPQQVEDLRPYSHYYVRVNVTYVSGRLYDYSLNSELIPPITTLAGVPSAPEPPEISATSGSFLVQWKRPLNNGPGEPYYVLQAKSGAGSWQTVYQGEAALWEAANLTNGEAYIFRVAGQSPVGLGPFSPVTQPQTFVRVEEDGSVLFIVVGVVVGVLVLVALFIIVLIVRHRFVEKDKWHHNVTSAYLPDTELETLRNYPTTIVQKDNSQYVVTSIKDGSEIALPNFPRERLKLITFLGSGAFGEVFEGLALNIYGPDSGENRVAVKTLRQGATDQDKQEFMKEAALMGNFQDKNILGLLGVCLDNDPQFIILELMEGGDLLSFLRGARGTSITPCRLSPLDLIDIVIDVAKGCRYLESLKFVHRDLAARNCLVSTKEYVSPDRRVKIGDFGLARDIYKSDYYRKEGEGLLPVRWMAPEALMDGVFSVQSDLWSFGVLVWEVMTLGQQPYPARTNVEVLHYVTAGGRLDRPDNCPDDLHHLMLKVWEKQPEGRPSFASCLDKLDSYRRKSSSMASGVDNPGFDNDSIKYLRLAAGSAATAQGEEDYLQPMNSLQSLRRPSDNNLDDVKAKAQEDARKYQEEQAAYTTQGARPKPKRNSTVPGGEPTADLEPRYTAAPSSFSKATGSHIATTDDTTPEQDTGQAVTTRKKKPLNMKGSWVSAKKMEKRARNAEAGRKRREEMGHDDHELENDLDDPMKQAKEQVDLDAPNLEHLPVMGVKHPDKKRRGPNPFRENSSDEAERADYTNWPKHIPEDNTVYNV